MLAELAGWFEGAFHAPDGPWRTDVRTLDAEISTAPFEMSSISEMSWLVHGRPDGPPWIAIVRLADGRWVYIHHVVEITGDIVWTIIFAATRARLWWWACTDDDRERLTSQLTPDERDDELVALDAMLDSPHSPTRELAEHRMTRIRR